MDRVQLWLPRHPPGFHDQLCRDLAQVDTLAGTDIAAARALYAGIRPRLLQVVGGLRLMHQADLQLAQGRGANLSRVRQALDDRDISAGTRLMLRIFGVAAVVAGFVGATAVVGTTLDARASTRWPTTPGRMESVTIVHHPGSSTRGKGTTARWTVKIRYRFTVGGREYAATRASWFSEESYAIRDAAQEAAARYRTRHTVPVHYDPSDPGNATLTAGATFESELAPYAMLFLGAVGVFLLVGRLRTLQLRIVVSLAPSLVMAIVILVLVG